MKNIAELRNVFAAHRHAFLKEFVPEAVFMRVQRDICNGDKRRVYVNDDRSIMRDSVDYPTETWVCQYFFSKERLEIIGAVSGISPSNFNSISSWMHIYQEGEYIPRHLDRAGCCQLVIGLEAQCHMSSGLLYLERNGMEFSYRLDPGDALLFEATKLWHWTTPLKPVKLGEPARRSVLVVRYYSE